MLQSTAVQGNIVSKKGTLVAAQAVVNNLSGALTAPHACSQIPNELSYIQIATKAPTLVARWVRPKSSHQLQSSYVLSSPRWITYKKQAKSTELAVQGGYTFRFSQIKLSSLPRLMIISCKPKEQVLVHPVVPSHFRTRFSDTSYADTFDCLYASGEDKSTALKITINEKASLVSTYTWRDLYNILLKAVPGFRYSYETWKREKQLIVLTADCFPSDMPASVFHPSTISIEAPFELSTRHRAWAVANSGVAYTGANGNPALPHLANDLSECSLSLFYEDSMALSSNAMAIQQFLVNASAVSQKPVSSTAPTLDGLQM